MLDPHLPPPLPLPTDHAADHAAAALLGDGAALRDILALAGPDMAPRLLAQIATDLTLTATQLAPAIAQRDWPQIRAQSHVLISVAGTIGAMGLHAAACLLNTAAHDRDEPQIAALAPALTADLARLIALVDAQRAAP